MAFRDQQASDEATRHKPRILCLHGGGVSAAIFRMQARALIRALPDFRLVFGDGPFFCAAGPGIIPVYKDEGPFRRWLRWLPEHPPVDDETAVDEIMYSIDTCKQDDQGDGEWVGVLGFSQGRSPIVSLGPHSRSLALVNAGGMSEGFSFDGESPHILKIPTLHVHGLNDPGLHLHRRMMEQYHDPDTVTLLEWDGDHRVPLKKADVDPVVREIRRIAREQGVRLEGN